MSQIVSREEIIYYELVKLEDKITQKADLILKAKVEIEEHLSRFEKIAKRIEDKIDNIK